MKTETEVWRLLCERLGFDTSCLPGDVRPVLGAMLPEGGEGLLDRLEKEPVNLSEAGDVVWREGPFPTPSGRIEFHSEEAFRLWGVDPVPDYSPLEEGHESPAAERFPLQLLTCKTRERIHSQFGNIDWIQEVERPRRLDMHLADARARALSDGDLARVWNDRGEIRLPVRISPGMRPGVVHVIEGRCVPEDPDVNRLTGDGVTDMNHGAVYYECLVEVSKA